MPKTYPVVDVNLQENSIYDSSDSCPSLYVIVQAVLERKKKLWSKLKFAILDLNMPTSQKLTSYCTNNHSVRMEGEIFCNTS